MSAGTTPASRGRSRRRTPCPSRRAAAGPCRRCCRRRRPCPPPARTASTPDWRPCPSARSTAHRPTRATQPSEPAPSPAPDRPTTRDSAHRKPPRRPGGCEKVASTRCPSGLAIRTFDKSYLPSSEGHSRFPAPTYGARSVGGSRLKQARSLTVGPPQRDRAEDKLTRLVGSVGTLEQALSLTVGPAQRDRAEDELTRIFGWLWDTIAGPVLEALGFSGR